MPTYKLTYFNIRGRAELSRLVFAAAGAEYEDDRINREDWPTLKAKMPQCQLPVLTVDGNTILPQSLAIARYLAREFGLAGKTNLEQAKCDVIIQTTEDVRSLWIKIFFEKDETRKAELTKKFQEEELPKFLGIFESTLKENNGGDGFFLGTSVTVADLAVYDVFEILLRKNADVLSKTPKLAANRKRVADLQKIKEYLQKRPDTEM